jgi:hypothetical protein
MSWSCWGSIESTWCGPEEPLDLMLSPALLMHPVPYSTTQPMVRATMGAGTTVEYQCLGDKRLSTPHEYAWWPLRVVWSWRHRKPPFSPVFFSAFTPLCLTWCLSRLQTPSCLVIPR